MSGWTTLLGMLGPLSVCVALVVLGLLSRRLGVVTHARPYYVGFFGAALLILISVIVRFSYVFAQYSMMGSTWRVVYNGLFASGVTIGVITAWRYWSWLLAERSQ
ncbi:MAG: hypothetical protein H7Y11_00955 [Armatimonadetes bacterium]|nr:hypothetical protein [Anaerolineae bacterium]